MLFLHGICNLICILFQLQIDLITEIIIEWYFYGTILPCLILIKRKDERSWLWSEVKSLFNYWNESTRQNWVCACFVLELCIVCKFALGKELEWIFFEAFKKGTFIYRCFLFEGFRKDTLTICTLGGKFLLYLEFRILATCIELVNTLT